MDAELAHGVGRVSPAQAGVADSPLGRWRAAGREVPTPAGPSPRAHTDSAPDADTTSRRARSIGWSTGTRPARPRRPLATLFGLLLALLSSTLARADTVRELVRIQGEGRSEVLGLGLVIGLPGTGDSGKELPAARVVAEVLRNMGNPVPDLEELSATKSVALVMVTCEIPAGGGRIGDVFDCKVSVMHTATDISGGTLLVAPLRGPLPGQGVYAFARGEVTVEDEERPTVGLVRQGAQLVKDLVVAMNGASFNLILQPAYAGHAAAAEIAGRINDSLQGRPDAEGPRIATAIDDRVIRIDIPEAERSVLTPFVADVMSTPIDLSTLRLPARVVVNRRVGSIYATEDVRISPVTFTFRDLTISITVPAVEPTPANPQVITERWGTLGTRPRESQMARLTDLQSALNTLRVPVEDQIEILHQLKANGQLHAELVVDGD